MVNNERCQRYITSLFHAISSEERMQIVERELVQMKKNNKNVTLCSV
jgi:hypothetical protein